MGTILSLSLICIGVLILVVGSLVVGLRAFLTMIYNELREATLMLEQLLSNVRLLRDRLDAFILEQRERELSDQHRQEKETSVPSVESLKKA